METSTSILLVLGIVGIFMIAGMLIRRARRSLGSRRGLAGGFPETEAAFRRLKAQFDAGKLTEAEFKARLSDLMVQDGQGRWWMIGYETGRWYVSEDDKWKRAEPPDAARAPRH